MLKSIIFTVSLVLSAMAFAQDTRTFFFAQVGNSYSAAIFSSDPDIGRRITRTEIVLLLRVHPGSDASEFFTDILLPIDTDAGTSVFTLSGVQQNWSGSGDFEFLDETPDYNGTLRAGRYGAETFGVHGEILDGSGITVYLDPPRCVTDIDDGSGSGTPDGGVTIDDLLYYLLLFGDGDARADLDDGSGTGSPDGGVTIEDLLFFLARFDLGC